MLGQQRRGSGQAGGQRAGHRAVAGCPPGIAQGHGEVAAPARKADAADGAALGVAQKRGLVPGPQLQQRGAAHGGAQLKIRQRAALGVFVPRAGQLAIVAAIDAVAHCSAKFQRYRPVLLDGQVRDAAPRVQPVRRHDGSGGAGLDAGRAFAAMGGCRGRQRQRQIGEDLAQKKHRPCIAVQQQGVLAAPADATALGQFNLQNRR